MYWKSHIKRRSILWIIIRMIKIFRTHSDSSFFILQIDFIRWDRIQCILKSLKSYFHVNLVNFMLQIKPTYSFIYFLQTYHFIFFLLYHLFLIWRHILFNRMSFHQRFSLCCMFYPWSKTIWFLWYFLTNFRHRHMIIIFFIMI